MNKLNKNLSKLVLFSIAFILLAAIPNSENKRSNDLEKRVEVLENKIVQLYETIGEIGTSIEFSEMPIGSIVPYYGELDNLPLNWILCNGKKIDNVKSPFHMKKIPYLKGYFIRGKTNNEEQGDKGGEDKTSSHRHNIEHKHEVGSHKHNFTTDRSRGGFYSNTINYVYDVSYSLKFTKGHITPHLASQKVSYFDDSYDNNHSHSGVTGDASTGHTANSSTSYSGYEGEHTNIPRYKAYNYIIKIF